MREDKLMLSFNYKEVSLVYPGNKDKPYALQYVFDEQEEDKLFRFFHRISFTSMK